MDREQNILHKRKLNKKTKRMQAVMKGGKSHNSETVITAHTACEIL